MTQNFRHQLFAATCGALVLAIFFPGCQPTTGRSSGNEGILRSEQDFRDKLAELRMQRSKVVRHIRQLEKTKSETIEFLKQKGIKSSADINNDIDIRYALRNLQGDKTAIDQLNNELKHYDEAIESIKAMLDELSRKAISDAVALTDEDFVELRKIVLDLNDRLKVKPENVLEQEELTKLLDEELSSEKQPSSDTDQNK
jgi:hypothetical protein